MAYRAAPLANGHSPAELLMGGKLRTLIPVLPFPLDPGWTDMEKLKIMEQRYRQKQKQNYDHRHRERDMVQLEPGDFVWVKDIDERGTMKSAADIPRSYIINTARGTLQRNRYHLSPTPTAPETLACSSEPAALLLMG